MSSAAWQKATRFSRAGLFCLVLSLAGLGCGKGKGEVTGKVTYQGNPLPYGTVTIMDSEGLVQTGQIAADGTYTVKDVSVGTGKIAVTSVDPREVERVRAAANQARDSGRVAKGGGRAQPTPDGEESKGSLIPTSFGDFSQSPLTVEVEKGSTRHDINLK